MRIRRTRNTVHYLIFVRPHHEFSNYRGNHFDFSVKIKMIASKKKTVLRTDRASLLNLQDIFILSKIIVVGLNKSADKYLQSC